MNKRRLFLATAASFVVSSLRPTFADNWPSRPVKIISPYPPGGTADLFCRILADQFAKAFSQSFYVDSRPGAGGMIGASDAARAEPDGYTLLLSGNASNILAPAFSAAAPFDGVKDFTHIAYLGGSPVVLVVHPSLPAQSYADFIDYVKESPMPVNYTSSGVGTHGYLFGEELAKVEGLKLNHIPYKGGGPAMIDLVAGQVKVATITFTSVAAQVRSGALRALAVSAQHRLPNFADLPTFAELGHPDLVSASWFALSGPKDLPRGIVDKLNSEVTAILELPVVKNQLIEATIEVKTMSPSETTRFFEDETARWRPLALALHAAENH